MHMLFLFMSASVFATSSLSLSCLFFTTLPNKNNIVEFSSAVITLDLSVVTCGWRKDNNGPLSPDNPGSGFDISYV